MLFSWSALQKYFAGVILYWFVLLYMLFLCILQVGAIVFG